MTDNDEKPTYARYTRPFRSLWSGLLQWRDWNIPVKLAAITILPLIFAIVLGGVLIGNQVEKANSYSRVDRLVSTGDQARKLVGGLQRERTKSAVLLAGGTPEREVQLADEYRQVDSSSGDLAEAVGKTSFGTEAAATRYAEVRRQLDQLPGPAHQRVARRRRRGDRGTRYTET